MKLTTHLDGSECILRKSKPKKSEIAKYWRDRVYEMGITSYDDGEPICWACGFYIADNDNQNVNASIQEAFLAWDKQTYLERCHVIPASMGGCSCHGNLVLLCKKCHKANPDTNSVELFLTWIKNRKNYAERRIDELKKVFSEFGLEFHSFNFYLYTNLEFREYHMNNSVAVRGVFTDASAIACLIEWKKRFTREQLINKIPEFVQIETRKNNWE